MEQAQQQPDDAGGEMHEPSALDLFTDDLRARVDRALACVTLHDYCGPVAKVPGTFERATWLALMICNDSMATVHRQKLNACGKVGTQFGDVYVSIAGPDIGAALRAINHGERAALTGEALLGRWPFAEEST